MNTTETNKKLAEFLGRDKIEMLSRYITDDSWLTDEMVDTYKFNSDWSWLMLVVDKIEGLILGNRTIKTTYSNEDEYINAGVSFRIDRTDCFIDFYGDMKVYENFISCTKYNSKIEAVYNTCSMFVDWYNGAQKN